MKSSSIRQLPQSFAKLFGFFIVALVLASGTCRFNRVKAQDGDDEHGLTYGSSNWCKQSYYEATYGEDWHLYWAAHFCWLYTSNVTVPAPGDRSASKLPRTPIKFAVRGR